MKNQTEGSEDTIDRFSQIIGHSRYIVLLAVVAVLLVAMSLFIFGAVEAVTGIWHAWRDLLNGELSATRLTVQFLEVVSVMLKAVVFYIIGVGLYSLFVAPLNITVSLGVQTLNDLESKVVSVIVVILGVTFLEHFIRWEHPMATLQFAGALALAVVPLALFQRFTHKAKEEQRAHKPNEQLHAQQAMFEESHEKADIPDQETHAQDKPDKRAQ
ncbi:MAG: YqhA family protein [Burkholderiaceae bacterium]